MQEEGEKTKRKENLKKLVLIITLVLLILIILFHILIYRMGKIGYEVSNLNLINTIEITQDNINWGNIKDLDIFNNPQFSNEKIVVPMSSGSYEFVVKNTMNERVKYNIVTKEKNELNVNMKYKLKLNNVYVIGNESTWVDIEELNLEGITVEKNSSSIYTLEWYWEESSNDTEIGKQVYAEYKCYIEIVPELYNI